jgi:GNAT superfamily N-acetyltransferase
MTLTTRPAGPADVPLILDLIRDLAIYERAPDAVFATEAGLAEALFGASPRVFSDIAEWDGAPAGFCLWFYNFSTWRGRHGIYLEDLFVRPAHRGRGIGKALMALLASRCVEQGLERMEWAVLDWNELAIGVYRGVGAEILDDWRICRLSGDPLRALAATSSA